VTGRRLALFADVHGNLPALDAVLGDIAGAAIGAGDVYCLGDLVGYGPDPAGVVARVREAGIPTVRGNYDDGVGFRRGQCGCYYVTERAKLDGAASYTFTDAALSDADHEWLAALPDSIRLCVGARRVLLAHGSPRKINEYLLPDRTDTFLARLADAAAADVVCVGHVHMPYHRIVRGEGERRIDYISVPSAGKPKDGDPRAGWTELRFDADSTEIDVRVHRVAYDVETVAAAMVAVGLPPRLAEALATA
jgi:predicted phosphodiesterase